MPRFAPALAGLLLVAAPAAADVTPREVWEDWLASVQQDDAEITTEAVEETEDGLVIRSLSMTAGSEETELYEIEVDEIVLTQNSDGTVGVTSSPEYPIILTDTGEDGEVRATRLLVSHPGLEMTVADADGLRMHSFTAPEIRVTLEESLEDGEPIDITGGVVLDDVDGRYDIGEAAEGESSLTSARLSVDFAGSDAESGGDFDLSFAMEDIESANLMQLAGSDVAEVARALTEGESRVATLTSASSAFSLDSNSEGQQLTLAVSHRRRRDSHRRGARGPDIRERQRWGASRPQRKLSSTARDRRGRGHAQLRFRRSAAGVRGGTAIRARHLDARRRAG